MKEIQKVVQKLSREQESGGRRRRLRRRRRTNRYKNIKSPPVYWGDLMTLKIEVKVKGHYMQHTLSY